MTVRWVVVRVVKDEDGAKAGEVIGEVTAPDRPAALALARAIYPPPEDDLSVVSKVSWELSAEERRIFERRSPARLGRLVGHGGGFQHSNKYGKNPR